MLFKIFDVEQCMMLLEIEAPLDRRKIQLARRNMAKRWHPDIAPPGRRQEHEQHLQGINEAADQLERLADQSRGGQITKSAVKAAAAAARRARAEAGKRAYEEQQRAQENSKERAKNDPYAGQVPDHSVVHRYARCLSYPEWGVGSVTGVYFSADGETERQWARVKFHVGVRTIPAGSLQFVDFSKPDPGEERVQRFVTAAQHALAEGDFALAAKRLVYARDAERDNIQVLSLMAKAFWLDGDLLAAARAVRDWIRLAPGEIRPHRYAARIYDQMGAMPQALESMERVVEISPLDLSGWENLAEMRMRAGDRDGAASALERARDLAAPQTAAEAA